MSNFGRLNWADVGKGFLIAVGTVILTGLVTTLQQGKFPTSGELGALALTGLSAGVVYLLKNVFTNSDNELAKKESPK